MKNYKTRLKINRDFKILVVVLSFIFCIFILANEAIAASASLYLSPPSGTYTIGTTFLVKIRVNSGGEPINAAEGDLIFNPNELSITSISKTGSIFSLWTTDPTFSNSTGNIVFGGGTPNNFTGSSGTIATISFKAKASSSAKVSFSSGSILAADGKGTNILTSMDGATYSLKSGTTPLPSEETEYTPPITPSNAPNIPIISSFTHSDPDQWYSNSSPEFSWKIPNDVTAVKLLIGHSPSSIPSVLYDPPILEKKLDELSDGVWYFHIRFENQYGWGEILHRKILIDTQPPEPFEVNVIDRDDLTDPNPILDFKTTDSLSGIEYYEIRIGDEKIESIPAVAMILNPYKLSPQESGEYPIVVRAVDKAGNSTAAATNIIIIPIEKPVIVDIPKSLEIGESLRIRGTSIYPESGVIVFIQKQGGEAESQEVRTDEQGDWLLAYDKSLEKGNYKIWAQSIDERGAKSMPTDKFDLSVALPAMLKFGTMAISYLIIIATLVVLVVIAVGAIFYIWYKVSLWRKRISKETGQVNRTVSKAFKALKEEVQAQIEYLDKKPGMTKKEKEIRDKLQEALNVSEEFINKEVKDIERELK